MTHKVQVEYGNVGVDFKYVPREGFGWMNASYQIGLNIVTKQMRRALGTCTSPDIFFERTAAIKKQKQVVETAKAITQNGQTTTAITVIVPPGSSVIMNSGLKRKVPSLSPDTSQQDLASSAIEKDDGDDHNMDTDLTTPEDEPDYYI